MNSIQEKFEDEINSKSSPVSKLHLVGIALTVIYLIIIAVYAYFKLDDFIGLKPNEFGDFLAGAFAPLAFAWLILGFFQQGYELRQNSASLKLQAEELRSAAIHAGSMVQLQRYDIDTRIKDTEEANRKLREINLASAEQEKNEIEHQKWLKTQPKFSFPAANRNPGSVLLSGGYLVKWTIYLTNDGASCSSIKFIFDNVKLTASEFKTELEAFGKTKVLFVTKERDDFVCNLSIEFADEKNMIRNQQFVLRRTYDNLEIIKK